MKKREPSPAAIAARELAAKIAKLSDAERMEVSARLGTVATIDGRTLSLKNSIMVKTMFGAATIVGGFNQWKAVGRTVKEGSKAVRIFAPTPHTVKEDDGSTTSSMRFRLVPVFDVSQTEEAKAA